MIVAVEEALVAVRYSPYLKNFYERIKQKKSAGKAIIASARKLLGIIYRTLKYNWVSADSQTLSSPRTETKTLE